MAAQSLLSAIKALGGINIRETRDLTGESRTGRAGITVGVFRTPGAGKRSGLKKQGFGLDEMVVRLREQGFNIPDDPIDGGIGELREMISCAIHGQQIYSGSDEVSVYEQEMARQDALDREYSAYQETQMAQEQAAEKPAKRKPGRPALADGLRAVRAQVSLDQATIDRARALGAGNLSDGIRKAVELACLPTK